MDVITDSGCIISTTRLPTIIEVDEDVQVVEGVGMIESGVISVRGENDVNVDVIVQASGEVSGATPVLEDHVDKPRGHIYEEAREPAISDTQSDMENTNLPTAVDEPTATTFADGRQLQELIVPVAGINPIGTDVVSYGDHTSLSIDISKEVALTKEKEEITYCTGLPNTSTDGKIANEVVLICAAEVQAEADKNDFEPNNSNTKQASVVLDFEADERSATQPDDIHEAPPETHENALSDEDVVTDVVAPVSDTILTCPHDITTADPSRGIEGEVSSKEEQKEGMDHCSTPRIMSPNNANTEEGVVGTHEEAATDEEDPGPAITSCEPITLTLNSVSAFDLPHWTVTEPAIESKALSAPDAQFSDGVSKGDLVTKGVVQILKHNQISSDEITAANTVLKAKKRVRWERENEEYISLDTTSQGLADHAIVSTCQQAFVGPACEPHVLISAAEQKSHENDELDFTKMDIRDIPAYAQRRTTSLSTLIKIDKYLTDLLHKTWRIDDTTAPQHNRCYYLADIDVRKVHLESMDIICKVDRSDGPWFKPLEKYILRG
ncbi:hypothetical protein HK102_002427 [Quaeritorhiza haematococci]|nr:hypothetical protein HK102_002427 [Quaeritorhiza haematococci]